MGPRRLTFCLAAFLLSCGSLVLPSFQYGAHGIARVPPRSHLAGRERVRAHLLAKLKPATQLRYAAAARRFDEHMALMQEPWDLYDQEQQDWLLA